MSDPVAIALIGIVSSAILGANAMLSASLSRRALRDIVGGDGTRTLSDAVEHIRHELVWHIEQDARSFADVTARLDDLARHR